MPFCGKCGNQVDDGVKFCPQCGNLMGAAANANKQNVVVVQEESTTCDPADIEKNKVMAVLSYLGILCLIPLFAAKESKFAQYHARQGFTLFIGMIALYIACGILTIVPILGLIFAFISFILWIPVTVLSIIGIINAVQGAAKALPVIGKYDIWGMITKS